MRAILAATFWLATLLGPLTASAQGQRDPVLAETLFRQGRAAVEGGDLATACSKFSQSYRLDPAPGTLLNLADCEERRGQLANAWQHFIALRDTLAPTDDRRELAQKRADLVAARLPKLRILLAKDTPQGARVLRDGALVDPAAIGVAVPVDPGAHVLVLRAPDRADSSTKLTLSVSQQKEITLAPGARLPPPVVTPPPPEPRGLGTQRIVAIAIAGVGVASAGVSAAFGGLALSSQSQAQKLCTSAVCTTQKGVDLHATARTEALVADLLFATAVVAVAAGAVVWLTAKRHHETVSAFVAPSFGGVELGGTF